MADQPDIINYRFRLRRGKAATWQTKNDVLLACEIGVETDTGRTKLGDGTTAWNDLPYWIGGPVADFGAIADGQVLAWDADHSRWAPTDMSQGGGGGTSFQLGAGLALDGSTTPPTLDNTRANLHIDGRVDTYADLPMPPPSGATTYLVQDDGLLYVWDGSAWPAAGTGVPASGMPVYSGSELARLDGGLYVPDVATRWLTTEVNGVPGVVPWFALPTPDADPYWDHVITLMHFDGTDGGATFTDSASNATWMREGSVGLSASAARFGSAALAGTDNGYIQSSDLPTLTFGNGIDMTFEAWVKLNSASSQIWIFDSRTPPSDPSGLFINIRSSVQAKCDNVNVCSGVSFPVGEYAHFALCVHANQWTTFVNGVQRGKVIAHTPAGYTPRSWVLVGGSVVGPGSHIDGAIDDLRVTQDVARYRGNFEPPTRAFPDRE